MEHRARSITRPSYIVRDGRRFENDDSVKEWENFTGKGALTISYTGRCPVSSHSNNSQFVVILVKERNGHERSYLLLARYCKSCNQYYISSKDYEVVYRAGRSNVLISNETQEEYYIQSGDVFDQEYLHLKEENNKLRRKLEVIKGHTGFANPYKTADDYEELVQLQYDKRHNSVYEEKTRGIRNFMERPYGYRVDLIHDNQTTTYYLGVDGCDEYDGKIISTLSAFGRELVNYRNVEIVRDSVHYKVRIRRQFDIDYGNLFGYMEQSQEDSFFSEGLTDQFLIKVLKQRRKLHQLTDIMFTIQKNQNEIMDAPLLRNILVQGCAGSGKTVVMLQRLAVLKYENPTFDFDKVVILTPNTNFNVHIKGLVSSLRLGSVKTISIEGYYAELLRKYSEDLEPKGKVLDEMELDQNYVDYMYSEDFLKKFWKAYHEEWERLKELYQKLLENAVYILNEETLKKYKENGEVRISDVFSLIQELKRRIDKVMKAKEIGKIRDAYHTLFPKDMEGREAVLNMFSQANGITILKFYDQVYKNAFTKAYQTLCERTGQEKVKLKKGTYRFDLYLQLHLSRQMFGVNPGDSKLICIDEGQDISLFEYALIQSLQRYDVILNVFGDTNQLLKKNRGISSWRLLEPYLANPLKYKLNENFRNTNQITEFCNDRFGMHVLETGLDGSSIRKINRKGLEEELGKELSHLKFDKERIALLLPRRLEKDTYLDSNRLPKEVRDRIGGVIDNGRICIAYVDEVKGIEFDSAYVVMDGMTRNEQYIACTRALSNLTLVV